MIGGIYYKLLTFFSRWCGLWLFRVGAWWVATGFFCFYPQRVAASMAFYRALWPERRRWFYLACAWRQFHRFTGVFLDRFLLQSGQTLQHTSEGMEHLDALLESGSGGILLMSHVGNWESAAHFLKQRRRHLPLLLYMGARQKEQIEKLQKADLAESGIRIIVADESAGAPFDTVEGIQHLKRGGLVSLSGDRVWHSGQRTVTARFLGRPVPLPVGPHVFAMLAGVPLLTFFCHGTGPRGHHVVVGPPRHVRPSSRTGREAALQASVQAYADALEAHVRRHPFDWFHFGLLWEEGGDA
jgi:predicted LPLAT superfamily acyltransferase